MHSWGSSARQYLYSLFTRVLKSRDITLPTKAHIVKAMVFFPGVTNRCETWTIKKAEHQRIDACKLWCWRRLLKVPWLQEVNPEGNQTWIFTGRTDAEAEAPVIWHLMQRPWCWEGLRAGGEEGDRGWDGWMAAWLNGHECEHTLGDQEGQGGLECCRPWGHNEQLNHDSNSLPLAPPWHWRAASFNSNFHPNTRECRARFSSFRSVPGTCQLLPSGFSRVWLCATLWTAALRALATGLSRQEHRGGLPFPSPY